MYWTSLQVIDKIRGPSGDPTTTIGGSRVDQPTASPVLKTALSFPAASLPRRCCWAPHPVYAQAAAAEAPVRDAAVLKQLAEVVPYLRAQKHFAVRADAVIDEVLLSGQKLQSRARSTTRSAAHKLRATVRSDRKHRD
jgi:hypothetical protein